MVKLPERVLLLYGDHLGQHVLTQPITRHHTLSVLSTMNIPRIFLPEFCMLHSCSPKVTELYTPSWNL